MIEDLNVFPLMQYEAEIGEENLAFFLSGFSCPIYNDNGFKSWTTRRNAKDGMVYDQMFAVLGSK